MTVPTPNCDRPSPNSELNGHSTDTATLSEQIDKTPPPMPPRRRKLLLGVGLAVGAIAVGFGFHWWSYAATHQETDDAYVTADMHPISVRVSGTVSKVDVADKQLVTPGQVLAQLDPRD